MAHVAPLIVPLPNQNNGAYSQISNDIIVEIIIYAMGGTTATLPAHSKDPRWILSHVCRRWRGLVMGNPDFWTNFRFLPVSRRSPNLMREMTQAALERSQMRSVDLYFDSGNLLVEAVGAANRITRLMKFIYGRGQFDIVSRILLPFASQIRSIKWDICTARFIKSFLFIPAEKFTLLETVDLSFVNDLRFNRRRTPFVTQELEKVSVFANLPSLRRVTLHMRNGLSAVALGLPLGNISVLDLGRTTMPPDDFMEIIFHSAPALLDGFFHITFTATPEGYDPVPIYIRRACGRNIRKLRLILSEPGEDERMFSLLTLPALEELKIAYYDPVNSTGWKMTMLARMLRESSRTLKTLSLRKDMLTPDIPQPEDDEDVQKKKPLGRLCEALPNLIGLHLSPAFGLPQDALDQFAEGELLPKLAFLRTSARYGSPVLRAVMRRNRVSLEQMNHGEPESSSSRGSVFYLDVLILAVPQERKSDVETECRDLKTCSSLALTMVDIVGEAA